MQPVAAKHVIIIVGPTAVGKTAVAVDLARRLHTNIISADSRQCYKELNIGVARPSPEELAAVKHYFIASHSVKEPVNAASFEQHALQVADKIFQQQQYAVMVGGTGLYIKTFCEGLDEMPVVSPLVRKQIIDAYKEKGLDWLQQELRTKDPAFWKIAEQQNPQRLMRALEIMEATGQSITVFRQRNQVERPFTVSKIGLELPRERLYERINARVDQMMEAGLLEEVRSVAAYQHLNALQTVGYKELFQYLAGQYSLDEAVHLIKQNTRHYAKRQMTWFKKDSSIQWIDARNAGQRLSEFYPES